MPIKIITMAGYNLEVNGSNNKIRKRALVCCLIFIVASNFINLTGCSKTVKFAISGCRRNLHGRRIEFFMYFTFFVLLSPVQDVLKGDALVVGPGPGRLEFHAPFNLGHGRPVRGR